VTSDPKTQKTYYAYSGSIITVTPKAGDDSKVFSIKVTNDNLTAELRDMMTSPGFSFQLPKGKTSTDETPTKAAVTFGKYDPDNAYRALVMTPYSDSYIDKDSNVGLLSDSTNIGENVSVLDVLYSFNDGERSGVTENANKIKSKFQSAPRVLNGTVSYYMRTPDLLENEDGKKQSGAEALAEMLEKSVSSKIREMLPGIVNNALSSDDTVKTPMKNALAAKQTTKANQTLTGAAKSAIVKQLQSKYPGTEDSNFTITASFTPLLTAASEAGIPGAEGKSVETQLNGMLPGYLSGIAVDYHWGDDDNSNYEAEITPTAAETDGVAVVTLVANLTAKDWPTLTTSSKMADFAETLRVYVAAQITGITVNIPATATTPGINTTLTSAELTEMGVPAYSLYTSDQLPFSKADDPKEALKTTLTQVDTDVANAFTSRLVNGKLPIDMGVVLQDSLIQGVVNEALQGPMETLVGNPETGKKAKIPSLGEGKATEAAIKKIAQDLISVKKEAGADGKVVTSLVLMNKSKNKETTELGKVNERGNLVLTIDFEKILRDASDTTPDNTVYENLIDLLIGIRNGISSDIMEAKEGKQTAQSVIAALLESRMNTANAVKWGTTIGSTKKGAQRNMTDTERQELANLLAGLAMNSSLDSANPTAIKDAWAQFEASGYSAVEFRFTKTFAEGASAMPFVKSLNDALSNIGITPDEPNQVTVGMLIKQNITPEA
jgi:hypothetical protein